MNKKAKSSPFTQNSPAVETEKNYINKNELTIVEARKLLPENLKHLNINPREYKFLAVYCSNNFNAEDAVEKAGYVERNKARYRAIAYTLLQRKEIVEAIRIYIDTIIQPYKDRLEMELLNVYYRRAMYTIDKFYDSNGNPLPVKEIDKDFICCIDDIKYVKNGQNLIPAYQLPNRDLALQALYRFITGQDINATSVLPEEAQKKMKIIYNNVLKISNSVKPQNIKKKVQK
ncbi:terminase small subunit [Methanobrevibacter sp.]|uniref:terminase small subunit n=1 Tax=Methanobrevibacter sp. TaxID=66852 RepID=UPI00386976B1